MFRLSSVLIAVLAALCAPAQNPTATEQPYTIKSNVERVVLPVSVLDHKGEHVSGLGQQNFQVFEDGKPQQIRFFSGQDTPVTVGLIVDDSGSMTPKRQTTILAAADFIRRSNPQDEMFVINFNERVAFGLPSNKPFSADVMQLSSALSQARPAGKTALYDAIVAGLEHLGLGTRDNKALLVVSDGGDNASRHSLNDVLDLAKRSNAVIYAIGLLDPADPDNKPGVLRKLARLTGGEAFLPQEIPEVRGICDHIAQDLRHQYLIGYAPSNDHHDGAYRKVQVVATAPDHKGKLSVRTRPGYYAPRDGSPS